MRTITWARGTMTISPISREGYLFTMGMREMEAMRLLVLRMLVERSLNEVEPIDDIDQ